MPSLLDSMRTYIGLLEPEPPARIGLLSRPDLMTHQFSGPAVSQPMTPAEALQGLAMGTMFWPGVGDAAGLAADAAMFMERPETRTPANFGMSALGLLPLVPPAAASIGSLAYLMNRASDVPTNIPLSQRGSIGSLQADVYRGGKPGASGEFFSRDIDYAKGFDRGDFGQYAVNTERALKFDDAPMTRADLAPILDTLRREGDDHAAKMISQVLDEDGYMLGGELYQVLQVVGSAAPEYYLSRAGIEAIDTGRDIRVIRPTAVSRKQ